MESSHDFEVLASRFVDSFDKNRDSVSLIEKELLDYLFRLFEKVVEAIEKGKIVPQNVLKISLDSWSEDPQPYSDVTHLVDSLKKINKLKEFEKKYCLFFFFDQVADRDSYADPKHYILRITWDYTCFLKKVKNGNNQSKVLRRVMN